MAGVPLAGDKDCGCVSQRQNLSITDGKFRVQTSHDKGWKVTGIVIEASSSQRSTMEPPQQGGSLGVSHAWRRPFQNKSIIL